MRDLMPLALAVAAAAVVSPLFIPSVDPLSFFAGVVVAFPVGLIVGVASVLRWRRVRRYE